jgi:pimeloyl-ACP methyl ester carboxylesterase
MGRIEGSSVEVDGVETFFRRSDGDGLPTVLVHGNPTSSEDWIPFMERLEGPAVAPDIPGWGRSERPSDFDYTMNGLAAHHARFLEALGIGDHHLVVHDWGSIGLIAARDHPAGMKRVVVINAVPLFEGYRWHWVARLWRRRGVGELFNLTANRPALALGLRQASGDRGPMPRELVDSIWRHRQNGTGRPTLQLYRDADPEKLAAAGSHLGQLEGPALVVWGLRDPYLGPELGRGYEERLAGAALVEVPDAGHWPWIDRPDVVGAVAGFLEASRAEGA